MSIHSLYIIYFHTLAAKLIKTEMKRISLALLLLLAVSSWTMANTPEDNVTRTEKQQQIPDGTIYHRPISVLSAQGFERIFGLIKAEAFDDDKFKMIEIACTERYLTVNQCLRLMKLFTFDDERLKVLKHIGPRIADRENIYEILDALSFPSSQDKARNIMQIRKRPQW